MLIFSHFYNENWFFSLGLPLSLLWLTIIWLVSWLHFKGQQNWFITTGILAVVAIPGNIITRWLVDQGQIWSLDSLINLLASLSIAGLCFYLNKKFIRK